MYYLSFAHTHTHTLQYVAGLGLQLSYQFYDVFGLDPDLLMMIPHSCVALLIFPIIDKVCVSVVIVILVVLVIVVVLVVVLVVMFVLVVMPRCACAKGIR